MVQEKKFRYIIDQETELRLLEEEHTETLFALTDENRQYLQQWLSWFNGIESSSDIGRYIRSASRQFDEDRGFQAGEPIDHRRLLGGSLLPRQRVGHQSLQRPGGLGLQRVAIEPRGSPLCYRELSQSCRPGKAWVHPRGNHTSGRVVIRPFR